VPPRNTCVRRGHASSEVTRAICRVPSAEFSQAPGYALPVHLCRFRVRSIRWGSFLEPLRSPTNPIRLDNTRDPSLSTRPTIINVVPITYAFRPRLRGRLTLLRLTLSRNPWTFGEGVSHTLYRYSCQHSHFPYLHGPSRVPLHQPRERSATTASRKEIAIHSFGAWLQPRYIFGARTLNSRPVSCYAFFK
jgi:hypothetical protein